MKNKPTTNRKISSLWFMAHEKMNRITLLHGAQKPITAAKANDWTGLSITNKIMDIDATAR